MRIGPLCCDFVMLRRMRDKCGKKTKGFGAKSRIMGKLLENMTLFKEFKLAA